MDTDIRIMQSNSYKDSFGYENISGVISRKNINYFFMVSFNNSSKDGIDGGKIVKLFVHDTINKLNVIEYNKTWIKKPYDPIGESILEALKEKYSK